MTGTVATPLSAFFSPSLPRGMMRSTTPVCVASSASSSRPPRATSAIAPSGTPAPSAASAAIAARTAFECAADGDDAERDADLAHVEAVRQPEAVDDFADRIGQRRDRARAGGDAGDARLVE